MTNSTASAERWAIGLAGTAITALTGAAFWLSYAHLASVAQVHGLGASPARMWAWPMTIDLFILAGEVLMFRGALRGRTDWWAVALTVTGSVGSIGLNVAGVGGGQPVLNYVVAAVPPAAALLAFGALMRQVHGLLARADSERDTPPVVQETAPAESAPEVSPTPEPTPRPAPVEPLVICGEHLAIPAVPPRSRLSTEDATAAIESAWRDGLSVRDAARLATRSPAQVQRVFTRLESATGPQPMPGQIPLEGVAA
jgi:hypothetical protein